MIDDFIGPGTFPPMDYTVLDEWTPSVRDNRYNNVTLPKHYQLFNGDKQVIDLINDRVATLPTSGPNLAYQYGNAIKYLMRWTTKNGVEDLEKCRQYLDMMIEEIA